MSRDTDGWLEVLENKASSSGVAGDIGAGLSVREFFRVELGLFFLSEYAPGQPATLLRKLLDGYALPAAGTETVVRNVRRRMGPTARGGQWRLRLNDYCKVPTHLRLFELDSDTDTRVVHGSVFRRRGSSKLPEREQAYRDAMSLPVDYNLEAAHDPASPGMRVRLKRVDGTVARFRIPDWLEEAGPERRLEPKSHRTRTPFPQLTEDDFRQAAKEMDQRLSTSERYRSENFTGRLERTVFARTDREAGCLTDGLGIFAIEGVAHVVGLMNAGKTTFNDILVKICTDRGLRVGYLVSSVGNALEKVRFFRALGIDAVPLIGHRSRPEHMARYWDDSLYVPENGQMPPLPDGCDSIAEFTTDICLLESLLVPSGPVAKPLSMDERPCRDKLRVDSSGKRARIVDCPLLAVCPAQAAVRRVPTAQVWVATPAALLASRAAPASYSTQWVISAQHELDLLVADEADQVMTHFDKQFMHHEPLTSPDGWSSRIALAWHEGLAKHWYRPLAERPGKRYQKYATYHSEALAGLLPLLMRQLVEGQEGKDATSELLAEVTADGPFSGHTLLTRLARALHGISSRVEEREQSHLWERAEEYFHTHFARLVEDPFGTPPTSLKPLVDMMTAGYDTDESAEDVAQDWITHHIPEGMPHPGTRLAEFARVLVAGCWSARITSTVFELSHMQESLRSLMGAVDTNNMLAHQPKPELLAVVPEQPMGNMMALQWTLSPKQDRGSLDLLWLRGVGRWLLYHLHDLLACEGVEGPHVLLSSATSYNPLSARYHIDILPTLILREPPDCAAAIRESRLFFRPRRRPGHERGIYVSGAGGRGARQAAVRAMTDAVCTPDPGAAHSLLDQVLQGCDPDRQRALFVLLSTEDAATSAHYMNTRTAVRAVHVVPDRQAPGLYGLNHRRISAFPRTGAHVMAAAEGSAGRGHNMLNDRGVAAVQAIFYLARLHPPPTDLAFPLAVLNAQAMQRLLNPVQCDVPGTDAAYEMRKLSYGARATWSTMMGRPLNFRAMKDEYLRHAFVADQGASLYQTTGRGLRGNVPVNVYLLDAAFAPRAADPRDTASDTERTSVLVACRDLTRRMLADPGLTAGSLARLNHQIYTAVWGLLGHLLDTIDWG
ncbi:pPIWI_RE_Z domain-containing protein [Streptomyces sp. NPDC002287]